MELTPEGRVLLQNLMTLKLLKNFLVLSGARDSFNTHNNLTHVFILRHINKLYSVQFFVCTICFHIRLTLTSSSSCKFRSFKFWYQKPVWTYLLTHAYHVRYYWYKCRSWRLRKNKTYSISKTKFEVGINIRGIMIRNITADHAAICCNSHATVQTVSSTG
jgi:hypothetical protein